jgi:hypothetical protein
MDRETLKIYGKRKREAYAKWWLSAGRGQPRPYSGPLWDEVQETERMYKLAQRAYDAARSADKGEPDGH